MNFFKQNKNGFLQIIAIVALTVLIVGFLIMGQGENNSSSSGEKSFQTATVVGVEVVSGKGEEAGAGQSPAPAETKTNKKPVELFPVVKVVDGDTITVLINGSNETLRLIGINTPETVDPRKPVECFGKEASTRAKELLSGKSVGLETDPTQGERDKYNRLLRYVYLPDGTFYNKLMISDGFAYEYTYNTPYKYQTEFKQAEKSAQQNKLGLWADGACEVAEESQPEPKPQVLVPATTGQYNCSANVYNCIDFATHDEAQAVFEACGGVGHDIHKLDGNNDGVACENLP